MEKKKRKKPMEEKRVLGLRNQKKATLSSSDVPA